MHGDETQTNPYDNEIYGYGTVVASAALDRGTTDMKFNRDGEAILGLAPKGTAPKAKLYSIRHLN